MVTNPASCVRPAFVHQCQTILDLRMTSCEDLPFPISAVIPSLLTPNPTEIRYCHRWGKCILPRILNCHRYLWISTQYRWAQDMVSTNTLDMISSVMIYSLYWGVLSDLPSNISAPRRSKKTHNCYGRRSMESPMHHSRWLRSLYIHLLASYNLCVFYLVLYHISLFTPLTNILLSSYCIKWLLNINTLCRSVRSNNLKRLEASKFERHASCGLSTFHNKSANYSFLSFFPPSSFWTENLFGMPGYRLEYASSARAKCKGMCRWVSTVW